MAEERKIYDDNQIIIYSTRIWEVFYNAPFLSNDFSFPVETFQIFHMPSEYCVASVCVGVNEGVSCVGMGKATCRSSHVA